MEKVLVECQLCLKRLSMNGIRQSLRMKHSVAIAGVFIKDYMSKLCLSVQSITWCIATTKAQGDCSFQREM